MKSRNILIIALLMAVVTTVLFIQYLKNLDKKYKDSQNKVSIVVSKQDIPKNQKVTKDMLEIKSYSAESVNTDALKKIEDVEGKYSVTDIKAGEQLFASRFTSQSDESSDIARKIKKDYRAISVEVNPVESLANMLQPEDYVDVVGSIKPPGSSLYGSQTILENVRVLAVGNRLVEKSTTTTTTDKDTSDQKSTQPEYTSITLELKPEDAKTLADWDVNGNVRFILRSEVKN